MAREYGQIKWYGGYNHRKERENDFGFIEAEDGLGGEDVFVHRTKVFCDESALCEGVPVSFDLREERKGPEAVAVRLLKDEVEAEVLAKAVFSRRSEVRAAAVAAVKRVTDSKEVVPELVRDVERRVKELDGVLVAEYCAALPDEILNSSEVLRGVLPPKRQLELLLREDSSATEGRPGEDEGTEVYVDPRISALAMEAPTSDEGFWQLLPSRYLDGAPEVRDRAPAEARLRYILNHTESAEWQRSEAGAGGGLHDQLLSTLAEVGAHAWESVPPELARIAEVWSEAPPPWRLSALTSGQLLARDVVLLPHLLSGVMEALDHVPARGFSRSFLPQKERRAYEQKQKLSAEIVRLLVGGLEWAGSDGKALPEIKATLLAVLDKQDPVWGKTEWGKEQSAELWEGVPDHLVADEAFWAKAPIKRRASAVEGGGITLETAGDHVLRSVSTLATAHLGKWGREARGDARLDALREYVVGLPGYGAAEERLLPHLPAGVQVAIRWDAFVAAPRQTWGKLSPAIRMLTLFRAAKGGVALPLLDLIESEEQGPVRSALIVAWGRSNPDEGHRVFWRAHRELQDFVVTEAWSSTEPLDMHGLLPECRPRVVRHCEGRPWPEEGEEGEKVSRAFCPRKNRPCGVRRVDGRTKADNDYNLYGARLYPETDLRWSTWSLAELLAVSGVVPDAGGLGLRSPDEYVPKLSGWVNRLNEIRERLACSACGAMMRPNYEYAKNLARYNVTIVSCDGGGGHDQNIYLNHCWSCREIVDSRESSVQDEDGYYICIHCGSGAPKSPSHTQGDRCPACGSGPMRGKGRYCVCGACNHEIRLPPPNDITGPRAQLRRRQIWGRDHRN